MVRLYNLSVGDEFTKQDDPVVYKLVGTEDVLFMCTGELQILNTLTNEKGLLDSDTKVTLVNVA